MNGALAGRCFGIALAALATSGATLAVETDDGEIASVPVEEGARWCLLWNHSVTGGAVADCFAARRGHMVLERSYLHDFAAGLGEVQGRGRLRSAKGGGYWIEGIDEPIAGDALVLRIGRPSVDHRLVVGDHVFRLSERAPGRRAVIRLTP